MPIESLFRAVLSLVAYVLPGYHCFKALEKRKPDELREWCEYWLVVAAFASVERLADVILWWLPMYHLLKILFVVYLWHPKTQGAIFIYRQTVQPFLAQHEIQVDRVVDEASAMMNRHVDAYFSRVYGMLGQHLGRWAGRLRHADAQTKAQPREGIKSDDITAGYVKVKSYGERPHVD